MSKANLHIFLGKVFHKRVFPKNHEFLYNYKSLYMKDVFSFSHNSFYQQKDFFFKYDFNTKQINEGIIPWLKRIKIRYSLKEEFLKLNLLKTPNTFFKKAFNPVCFWFVNYNDKTIGVIAEVTNTFKEQHSYYLSNNGNPITQELWLEDSKKLYVSPFADKIGRYKFNFNQEPLIVKINEYDPQENLEIITSLQGEYTQATGFMKFLMYISIMYNSFNVIPRIHIQALYLWIKKFKFYSHNGNGHV